MAEYIDRNAARKAILPPLSTDFMIAAVMLDAYDRINDIPAADVAPITKSRIVINNGRNVCFACCGEVSRDFKYCPWCGARYEVSDNA